MNEVNLLDPRVQRAIEFVEEQIALTMKLKVEKIPWIHYSPALTSEEIEERALLIEKYSSARPDRIEYYLWYHGCHEFAVFYWTVLRVNGIPTKIISQERPFRHTYLQAENGQVIDALLTLCGVTYPYSPETAQEFKTPHDFYAKLFISEEDRRDWEIELLEQLRRLE